MLNRSYPLHQRLVQRRSLPSLLGERVLAQEVEVAAAVGLQDFAAVEMGVAASVAGRRATRASRKSCPGLRTQKFAIE